MHVHSAKGKLYPLGMVLKHMIEVFNTEHFGIIELEKLVIMSDREKGLAKAVDEVLPNAKQSRCCQHIAANNVFDKRAGHVCEPAT
jgi:hypothetical protein